MNSARFPTGPLAALEVVEEHVHLPARRDGSLRVHAEPLRDGVGHDAEALAELVDEAEGELPVAHEGPDEEEPGRRGALVLQR